HGAPASPDLPSFPTRRSSDLVATMAEVITENTIPVLDHGFVALDGALATDLAVVNGARVSFNQESQEMTERDAGLIRFLMRERQDRKSIRLNSSHVSISYAVF